MADKNITTTRDPDDFVQHLEGVERVLEMLEDGRLRRTKEFICGAVFELRVLTQPPELERIECDPSTETLRACSEVGAWFKIGLGSDTRTQLIYRENMSEAEARLFAESLHALTMLAWQSVGLNLRLAARNRTDT